MPKPQKEVAARLTVALCLSFLFCLQPAPAAGQQNIDEEPITIQDLAKMLGKGAHSKNELIKMVAARGIHPPMVATDEGDLRAAAEDARNAKNAKALSEEEMNDIVKAVRANLLDANIDETIVLPLHTAKELEPLGFKATYAGRDGDDYVLEIWYPGINKKVTEPTRAGCEHAYKWGLPNYPREYRLRIDSTNAQQVHARLLRDVPPPAGPMPPQLPGEIQNYAAPCAPVKMRLVAGNHMNATTPIPRYYISEPINVGVFRYHARRAHAVKTPIPASAKDSDPITAIYYEDAKEIVTMLGGHLPTLQQWVNALHGEYFTLSSSAELVLDEDGNLMMVRKADSQNPSNTPLSPRVFTSKVPPSGLASGLLRAVRPAGPRRVKVLPNEQNRPGGP